MNSDFPTTYKALTGHPPFPWQQRLYTEWFAQGKIPSPCIIPTGLGKTSVIAVWLIAQANHPGLLPRRLVYVVNRRTVVDQTTDEVEKYRYNLAKAELEGPLRNLCGAQLKEKESPLALSTLRGQFADNREWSADPSRPAVICGTVDMIGSRLLFSGYGVGMKAKPLHAGFLGQDTLLVHDEAHLEPAFQKLLEAIRDEQTRCGDPWRLRVMELTATSRGQAEAFNLADADRKNATVQERIGARKALHLHELSDTKKAADELAAKALEFANSNRAVLVFARTVDDVLKIAGKLPKDRVVTLTGTMRGKERDQLVEHSIFKRFLPGGQSDDPTTYLVCTSAGEVGVNISADHLVCDLTPVDSMAQRFGRVNRFGQRPDTEVHVFHPSDGDFEEKPFEQARKRTLALLRGLNGNASPEALGSLDPSARQEAFTPPPTILPTSDILFDAWALTTIREKLPGRPPVEPYLHGITDWQLPETQVAWRTEVEKIAGDLLDLYPPEGLLDAYPLKPRELLKEPSYRAYKHFEAMAKRRPDGPVWLVADDGKVQVTTMKNLADKDNKDRINGVTVVFPPSAGGLEGGMLNGASEAADDVADTAERVRVWRDDERYDEKAEGMHPVLSITFTGAEDEDEERTWDWFALPNEGDKSAPKPVLWEVHVGDVVREWEKIQDHLSLPDPMKVAIHFAARFHDHGKKRKSFQRVLGNLNPNVWLAKSGKKKGRVPESYRHEFGSLLDVMSEPDFQKLSPEQQDLVLHLIAAHHGRARPHFPSDEAFDPERPPTDADRLVAAVPRRFARLQRKYGRWGLAYLESLLRAADWAASAAPSAYLKEGDA